MERKIGEIFEYDGEWCQCVESKQDACTDCAFNPINGIGYNCSGSCTYKQVIFKKLEKVGEPYSCNYYGNNRLIMMQEYNLYNLDDVTNEDKIPMYITDYKHKRIAIEIKPTKEDMEENKLNLKPFDLQKAKEGKPVCTRDGRKARIICFDKMGIYPVIALVQKGGIELCHSYTEDGKCVEETNYDLMMLPEKKEGWVNLYDDMPIYDTKEEALSRTSKIRGLIDTVKVSWEE